MLRNNFIFPLLLVPTLFVPPSENIGLANIIEVLFRKFNYFGTRMDQSFFVTKPILAEYDFIVVGSGPGGSVVANRLSEIPHWNVLLLETGREETVLLEVPVLVNYFLSTDFNWGYQTEKQEGACLGMKNQRCRLRQGKSLGGTSSINHMIYTRGNKEDYDEWAERGNTGWSYDEVLPYFLKSENNLIRELQNSTNHAQNGPLDVEYVPHTTLLGDAFLDAGQDMGYNVTDYNDGEIPEGFSRVQAMMKNGRRVSASKSFLRPVKNRYNLNISPKSRVTKILINPDTKTAYGVEFVKNRRTYIVKARKEVIISAGAAGSPQLLMLSGIGPKQHLKELNIPIIQDLQVGQNLQQQVSYCGLTFLVNQTYTGLLEHRLNKPSYLLDFFNRRTDGSLTIPGGVEGLAYFSTKHNDDKRGRPDIELIFASGSLTTDNGGATKRGLGISDEIYKQTFRPVEGRDSWTIVPMVLRPKSRGFIKLKSKNPWNWPLFYANYFQNEQDLDTIVEGIKKAIEISQTSAFQKYGTYLNSLPLPGCVTYEQNSDDYWKCAVRHLTLTIHQLTGTCKMGPPSDPDAVVSPDLKVYGINNLRVVDESIMPESVTGHPTAPAFMIGEKASDLIKNYWFTDYEKQNFQDIESNMVSHGYGCFPESNEVGLNGSCFWFKSPVGNMTHISESNYTCEVSIPGQNIVSCLFHKVSVKLADWDSITDYITRKTSTLYP